MKNPFDDEESEYRDFDKAKVLVMVIPFVLIIIILAITLIVNATKKDKGNNTEDLQQSIMEYADEGRDTINADGPQEEDTLPASAAVTEKEEASPENKSTEVDNQEEKSEATPTATPYKQIMDGSKDYSKVKYNKEEQLKEMMTYWADNNQKALTDLVNLDRFKAMSWALKGTRDFYYYGDIDGNGKPNGMGIAVYTDNQYYYGSWKNGVRDGNGTWMHYHFHDVKNNTDLYTYHQYAGSWKNDLPDGEGSEHYDYNTELFKENVGYTTNLIGSYSAGLVDGEFYLTNLYSNENTKEWYATAEHGSWLYQNDNKDKNGRRPVFVEDRDPDNYIWLLPKENVKIGVKCLISSNKN